MNVKALTDDQVLREAGNLGPDMIGQELFDRAQWIKKNNPGGVLGPAIVGSFQSEHEKANADQAAKFERELEELNEREYEKSLDEEPDYEPGATKTPEQEQREAERQERVKRAKGKKK